MSAPRFRWPFGGSLVGRLVLAQMGMALLLWLAACAYLVWDTARYDEIFEPRLMGPRADMILHVVDALADQPQRLAEALAKIDRVQRGENEEADDPALRMAMNVWSGSRLLYRTPGEPGAVHAEKLRQLERVSIDGKPWRTYSQASTQSDARVTLIRSGHVPSILFAIGGRGILVMPLLISLPFLILPAWLSVRLALRPWRRFSREIESRGPDDLAPLQFGSRYRELRPVARAVNLLLERVRAGMARERSFIADAAHELRTPLAAMRVNVEALQAHGASPRDRELLDGLVRSGERAQRLVAQLLGLMRSDAGPAGTPRTVVELDALAQDRLAALSPLADRRGVELELQAVPACAVHGEREGLVSLLDNLVENAIKHAPAGSTVTVVVARDGADVTLAVQDAGPGIPQELHERVFDRFYRVADQVPSGSGLGLAIVKAVAVRHDARVALATGPTGRGLHVTVRFNA